MDFLRHTILKDIDGLESIINEKHIYFALYRKKQCVFVNKAMTELFALTFQDFVKFQLEEFQRFIHKEDFYKIEKAYSEFRNTKKDQSVIIRIITANGMERITLTMFLQTFFNSEEYLLIVLIDLDDSLQRDRNLSYSIRNLNFHNNECNAFMEILPIGAISEDLNHNLIYINHNFQQTFGYQISQFINTQDWMAVLFPEETYRKEIQKVLLTSKEPKEVKLIDKNGKGRIVEWTSYIFEKSNQRIHFVKDISDQKKKEEDLLKEKKLESLSLLTGGIAHDYNNILFGIMGNLDVFDSEQLSEEGKNAIRYIRLAADRAKKLTRQLLTFAKGGDPVKKPATFDEILESAIDFASYNSRCKIITKYYNKNIIAHVDSDQIHQVITNLLLNAIQANENKGKVIITVKILENGFKMNIPSGKYIEVVVSDEGPGIPPEIAQKIFDPYFTTKKDGHGLGLAIVFSIIKKHYGYVGFQANSPKGASFFFYLPYYPELNVIKDEIHKIEAQKIIEPTTEVKDEAKTDQKINIESKKPYIIIMYDEEVVRDILKRMVQKLGFEPAETKEGQAAFEIYKKLKKENKKIACIIIDLTIMDGMSGIDLIRLIREVDKEVLCIVSSGYFDDPILSKYEENGFNDVLLKPYTIKNLKESFQKLKII